MATKYRRIHLTHPDGSGTILLELRFWSSGALAEKACNHDAMATLTGAQKEWVAAWVSAHSDGELDHEDAYRVLFKQETLAE